MNLNFISIDIVECIYDFLKQQNLRIKFIILEICGIDKHRPQSW